jgi:hypothetical protein
MANYIVILNVFNSGDVYYCNTTKDLKETLERASLEDIEKGNVRVFKIDEEIAAASIVNGDYKESYNPGAAVQHFEKEKQSESYKKYVENLKKVVKGCGR